MRKVQLVRLSQAERQDISRLVETSTPFISSVLPSKPTVTTSVQESHQLDSLPVAARKSISPTRRLLLRIWRERWVYVLLLPGLLYFLAFYYLPLLGNIVAFQDYSPYLGFFRSPWIGLANFARLFTDPEIGIAIQNTIIISLLQIIFAFPAGIALSLLLNALISERFKRFMQSVLYLPHFLGWVIIISIWQQIFGGDGFVNHFLVGVGGKPVDIMTNPNFFKPLVVLQVMWKESGWSTIIFLAAMTAIDLSLYEAAVVDGANKWQRTWHITLPGIRGIITLLLILRIGNILNTGFEQIFLQRTAVGLNASEVIDTFVYSRGLVNGDWGFAAAVALVKMVIAAILVYSANRMVKKFGEAGVY
jgi:putative aldouronate transport system permease protein